MSTDDSRKFRANLRCRKTTLAMQGRENDLTGTTAEERVEMVDELTKDAWAFKGDPIIESGLQRHLVRIILPKS